LVHTQKRVLRKGSEGPRLGLSDKERELLEALVVHGSVKSASEAIDVPPSTASQRLLRLKLRYQRAKLLVTEYERYKLRMPIRYLE